MLILDYLKMLWNRKYTRAEKQDIDFSNPDIDVDAKFEEFKRELAPIKGDDEVER